MAEKNPITPITASQFYVSFEPGLTDKLIKSVQEITFQGQTQGAEKALASTKGGTMLRQSTSTGFEENPNVTIEVYLREGDMDFYKWFQDTMPKNYTNGEASGGGKWAENRKDGSIVAYDPGGNEIMRWNMSRAWIKSYKVSDLSADSTDLAVETYEIVCEDIKRVS